MSLGTIAAIKEQSPITASPVVLIEVTFDQYLQASPPVLRLASHMLSGTAEGGGGFPYGGHDYLPRLRNTDMALQQMLSSQGIDFVPEVKLDLNDADGSIFADWEMFLGFKGATLTARFVFWEANTTNFSDDSLILFVGTCAAASCPDELTTAISAVNKSNMVNTAMPPIQLQSTCPWNFPQSVAQMQQAADVRGSSCYECGYSPLASGANAVGNLPASVSLGGSLTPTATTMSTSWGHVYSPTGATTFWALIDSEEVLVTGNTGGWNGTWTISRGGHGTTAASHSGGASVKIPYGSCDYTRGNCIQRLGNPATLTVAPDGDIMHDIAGNHTGRFGGSQWQPPAVLVSRSYISGKWEEIIFADNEAKFGDRIPLCYGTTWVNPLVLNISGDSNYSKYEVLLSYGQIQYVYQVVVNGVLVPHANNDTVMTQVPGALPGGTTGQQLAGGAWLCVNDGRRNGNYNTDTPWQVKNNAGTVTYISTGDCYGSLAVLHIIMPTQAASPTGIPSVQVLLDGQSVRVYSDPSTYSYLFSDNYAWVMMDLLQWAGWSLEASFNKAVWIAAAAYFDGQINFQNNMGVTGNTIVSLRPGVGAVPYKRFSCSLTVRQRTSCAELLRGLRIACKSLLVPNYFDGTLVLQPKNTLAVQQPSVAQLNSTNSSNYNTAVPSVDDSINNANGYAYYYFNESNIAEDGNGRSTFRLLSKSIAEQSNSVSVPIQNLENQYNQDSLTWVDVEDENRIGQPIISSLPALGCNSFDRAQRATATWVAENMRGNPRMSMDGQTIGDTNGSIGIQFQTSFRGLGLKVGDLVLVSYQQRGIGYPTPWLFRIYGIQPGMNARLIQITAWYHNDAWYVDEFGQTGAPLYRHPQSGPARPAFGWCPFGQLPVVGDAIYPQGYASFSLAEYGSLGADGTAIETIGIGGRFPVNGAAASPQPPLVEMQATTASTGGTLKGELTYYFLVCSKDVTGADYLPSFASARMAQVVVPSGTNTNTATVQTPYWDGVATGWVLFAGTSPRRLSYQSDGDATPSTMPGTITLTQYNDGSWGVPDPAADHIQIYRKLVINGGVADTVVISCTSTTIKVSTLVGVPMPTNFFAGHIVSLYATKDVEDLGPSQQQIPMFNALIASNTGDTLTLAAGLDGHVPDPTAVVTGRPSPGLAIGDVLVIRTKPTYGVDSGGRYVEDSAWVNVLNDLDSTTKISISAMTNANPGVATTPTAHGFSTGDLVYIQSMNGMTSVFPARFTVTVVDTTHFSIGADTSSAGTYTGGGIAYRQPQGLTVNGLKGQLWRVIVPGAAGYGVTEIIASNTATRMYFNGPNWAAGSEPTPGCIGITEEPTWKPSAKSSYLPNNTIDQPFSLLDDVSNYNGQSILVMAKMVNTTGIEAFEVDSPMRDFYVVGTPGNLSLGQTLMLTVDGTLAIGSDQAPRTVLNTGLTLTGARFDVKIAPTGADIIIEIAAGATPGTAYTVLLIHIPAAANSYVATSGDIASAAAVVAGTPIYLNLQSVGSTVPGAGLTATLYF